MKRFVRVVAALGMLVGGVVGVQGSATARSRPVDAIVWGACPQTKDTPPGGTPGVECATVRVPLDHREPWGQSITLAVNRIRGKVSRDANHLGTLLVNPGGPGASGLRLGEFVAATLPAEVAARYDVVGFDPRGVGSSRPALRCVDASSYYAPPRLDAVPATRRDERALLDRAGDYAARCGNLWAWLLPHMTTENVARDVDTIRAALGERQISYLGYSYGTYIGGVYATLFPDRVKRLVMDSSVSPDDVWYQSNLDQDPAFDRRHRDFLDWTARHNSVYKLGGTAKETGFAWYAMRSRLRDRPAGGVVGPSELDDLFTLGGYTDRIWPELARVWSAYVRAGDVKGLVEAHNRFGGQDAEDENGYAVYLSVQCRDAAWPRSWDTWRQDTTRMHRRAPFMAWQNAWFNAPCAFWPVSGGRPVDVHGSPKLPPILMLQSRGDAATPYQGALRMLRHFPTARMVVEEGGNHGVSLAGNRCVDRHLAAYLTDGTIPRRTTTCAALPEPRPVVRMAAGGGLGHDRLTDVLSG
ncbi:alpha/beta hydrolase [Nonomuraea cavernae]|uniref:Peptidase n=1 Tax=Nonomuraea cavernae TaxID=2045107 RepID=A0A917Z7H5_9ACTN|nr:alpha/beta hydrolase [Nonomuraea cavernae]MCA2189410.1 alpha/beta hydrolase [Nonomuraea cavernae]GGO76858.1 peptidase [Nonomuraea cavernae]